MQGGIVILAAGSSSRLGFPKQTFEINEKSLLQNVIEEAQKTSVNEIVVVLGANMETILEKIDLGRTTCVKNTNWQKGLSSSIVCGLNYFSDKIPHLEYVVFLVCDQPFLKASNIQAIIDAYHHKLAQIIASDYKGIQGTPALFDRIFFEEIRQLEGDRGAMSIIKKYPEKVSLIPFDDGIYDVDTADDLERLK
ncbi:MAG TPA: nucleotidyltransferase family protein [Saprospiraceae bacterium]|nr:nucleotidyltransferase family protein [Saprospiraceae bacterium]